MYTEIFKNGITEESLNIACDYAKAKIKDGITYRENIRICLEFYHTSGIIFTDESKKTNFYEAIKESLKVKPIVKIPTAKIDYIPTKEESYDAKIWVKEYCLIDEVGHWTPPIPLGNEPKPFSDREIAMAMAFRANNYISGIDSYKEEE